MAELNNVVETVKEVAENAAPQVVEATKEIVVKGTNVLAERAKGFAAGVITTVVTGWLTLCGIPAAKAKIAKKKAAKNDNIVADTTGEFVENNDQQQEVEKEETSEEK